MKVVWDISKLLKKQRVKSLCTLGTIGITEEVSIPVRNRGSMLCESISVQPNFFALRRMAVLEDLGLVACRDLIPLSNVFKVASLIGLWTLLVMKQKERAQLLLEVIGKQSRNWSSLLAADRLALVKSLAPAAGLTFCFFPVRSRAGVPGGKASGLTFNAAISITGATTFRIFGFASRGVKFGMESGAKPSMIWLPMLVKNFVMNFTILRTKLTFNFLPLSPCLIKLLFTELVEKLRAEIKLCETYLKKYIRQLWDLVVDFGMPLDEIRVAGYFNSLDANGVKQGNRISSPNIKDGGDHTTDVCTDLDNAFHVLDFTQTFNVSFDCLAMRFNKVELSLIPSNLLSIAMGIDSHQIALLLFHSSRTQGCCKGNWHQGGQKQNSWRCDALTCRLWVD